MKSFPIEKDKQYTVVFLLNPDERQGLLRLTFKELLFQEDQLYLAFEREVGYWMYDLQIPKLYIIPVKDILSIEQVQEAFE